uniref:PAT1 domain-containing protein n=1 Tax=Haemonchus placei TaxID=6290 RepID=A0A0N4X0Z7_HAEPC
LLESLLGPIANRFNGRPPCAPLVQCRSIDALPYSRRLAAVPICRHHSMLASGEMDLGRPDRSHCDEYMFGAIPDDDENSDDGAADEIDAINDETFGDDVHVPLDSELEDYAAQTACLRLDDGVPWDTPGCSKAPAPDASNVPLPDFDAFGRPSFSSFGSETMAKLDSLWSQRSHNLYDLWEEQKNSSRTVNPNQSSFVQNEPPTEQPKAASGFSLMGGISQMLDNASRSNAYAQQRSPVLPAMPRGSTLEDLERGHLQRLSQAGKAPNANVVLPPVAVNATDLERRFIEEAAGVPPPPTQVLPPCSPSQFPPPPLPSTHNQMPPRMAPNALPTFGGVPPMPMPPLLPPLHPMMIPFVPFWLDNLAGRLPCLPPGCPPVPPLLRMFFDTVKDPMIVMDMIRASNAGMVPPPLPVPPQTFDRRSQWQRKAPGMPSGRTIEDLAFDQFAGYMSCKEREWLVKIQILQCQGTGNPYEDDYYYTSWREKQIAKGWKPSGTTAQDPSLEKTKARFRIYILSENERRLRRLNGSRSHLESPREPKEIVPLNVKFAGSLGLPSKSSTSNPRHLISVEHSLDNADEDASQRAGKQRKLRTLLLRLESALALLLECQDLRLRMRNCAQSSESALSEISHRIDVIFQDLMTEDLVKILQIGKGRSVVARTLGVGTARDVARVVLSLFSVMGLCPKKCLEEINCEVVPHMFAGLIELSREQLMTLSSAVNIDSLKENMLNKNVFCRDAFITLLYACAKRKAISQGVVRWLSGPPDGIDFTDGWSSSLSMWRDQIPGLQDSDVQMFSEWLLLLCNNTHHNSLAKVLAKALLTCR